MFRFFFKLLAVAAIFCTGTFVFFWSLILFFALCLAAGSPIPPDFVYSAAAYITLWAVLILCASFGLVGSAYMTLTLSFKVLFA